MTRAHPTCCSCQRLRLGLVSALLLGVAAFVFFRQPSSQAGAPPFAPQTAAYFPSENKLLVAVALFNPQEKELAGKLDVELLADGRVVASASRAVRQQDPAAGYRFELTASKAQA